MKDFLMSVWSWLVTPWGEPAGSHGRPRTLEGGRYRGKHRMRGAPKRARDTTPEAGAWFAQQQPTAAWLAQHRADFAAAYARAQGRAA